VVCAGDHGTVVSPDTVWADVEGEIIFRLTVALYCEIAVKNGRGEQTNFDTYPMLCMNEAPIIEVHIVQSFVLPDRMGPQAAGGARVRAPRRALSSGACRRRFVVEGPEQAPI
jgi:isoquinoline 1-oxidoreductase beta subunit